MSTNGYILLLLRQERGIHAAEARGWNEGHHDFLDAPTTFGRFCGLKPALLAALTFWLLITTTIPAHAASLTLDISHRFAGKPLILDDTNLVTAAGQSISVTRLDYLMSDIALRRTNGTWLVNSNWQAFVSVAAKRTSVTVTNAPLGQFDRIRWRVGVRPELNHGDPAQHRAGHPLNPNLNGLHQGWQGGYAFLVIEGRWLTPAEGWSGWSFHLGNDPMLMTVELPVSLEIHGAETLPVILSIDRLFSGKKTLLLAAGNSSTRSRDNDPLAAMLHDRVQGAFTAGPQIPTSTPATEPKLANGVKIAPGTTPYRIAFARQFPPPRLPRDNPLTEEGVELGRRLFEDRLLSVNGTQSCASCHQASAAFTDTGNALSTGAEGRLGTRNAMPLFNLAWKFSFFWDGRASTLREQALMPIQDASEMHETLTNVSAKLSAETDYPVLFERAFGSKAISPDTVSRALEQYLLTLVSHDSKFDRFMQGRGDMTAQERRGFDLFTTAYDPRRGLYGADCFRCHGGPFLSNQGFANNGLDSILCDPGLYQVTGLELDRGRFAVPSLRNVAVTAPYMHDGRFKTLEEVVEHYSTGVKRTLSLHPALARQPDGGVPLSDDDKRALVAFLKTLTDESFLKSPARPQPEGIASRQ
ncbi:MAG TPA: MbnP family protein [Roseimicrobium sp.]|nr:MbnP family protein [Roseimicrobium sp.]